MKTSEIITAIIAVYGAVISTIAILRQVASDRVKVKVSVSKNMKMLGDPRYEGMTLTILTVTNIARRPVTIRSCGAIGLHPHPNFVIPDTNPTLPFEITEGKFITIFIDQVRLDFSTIDYWAVWDSRERVYKLREASRFKHWRSNRQLKRSFRKKKAS